MIISSNSTLFSSMMKIMLIRIALYLPRQNLMSRTELKTQKSSQWTRVDMQSEWLLLLLNSKETSSPNVTASAFTIFGEYSDYVGMPVNRRILKPNIYMCSKRLHSL